MAAGKLAASEPGPSSTSAHTSSGSWGPLPSISRHSGVHCDMPEIKPPPFENYVSSLRQWGPLEIDSLQILPQGYHLPCHGGCHTGSGREEVCSVGGKACPTQAPGGAGNSGGLQPHPLTSLIGPSCPSCKAWGEFYPWSPLSCWGARTPTSPHIQSFHHLQVLYASA